MERAALLRCRYAGRYDNLLDKDRQRPTLEESLEEQKADRVRVPSDVYPRLVTRGLLAWRVGGGARLTDAGRLSLSNSPIRNEGDTSK